MVKYGKQYREYQIEEWKPHYINYKKLKQKIKQIKAKLPKQEQPSNTLFGVSNINPMPLVPDEIYSNEDQNFATLFSSKYGKHLKEFIDILNEEFHKFYVFFSNTEKQLYQEINTHLYAKDNYPTFTRKQIKNEINSLGVSIYLAKCLNCFINDNLMAVKKILKKFDKNFVDFYGLIAPRYILSQISSTTNDLDYIIQFKIIDEASCVCEENANILKELYLKIENNPNINNINNVNKNDDNIQEIQVDFMQQYRELLMCVKEIDEIIDFKIQYKEWFSFIKKGNKLIKNNPRLLENDIYNPLLSSTNYKDSLIEKFLSSNKAFYEIEDVQVSVSELNKRNMNLILVHKFFYNTLITCLIPTLYFFINTENKDNKPALNFLFVILILALSHISSFISLYFFHHPGTKVMLIISYSLFFAGSLFHIISCNAYFNKANNMPRFFYLIISRVFIGIGSMELIGRQYIAFYSPKFYLIKISKNYALFNYLGYATGPLITCVLLLFSKNTDYDSYMTFNEFNCIGWYGLFTSIILILINIFLFTNQNAKDFQMIRDEQNLNFAIKTSFHSDRESRKGKTKEKLHRKSKANKGDLDVIITKSDLLEGLVPEEGQEKKEDKEEKEDKKEEILNVEDKKDEKEDKKHEGEEKKDELLKVEEKNEENKIEDNIINDKNEEKKENEKEDEEVVNIEDESRKNSAAPKKKKLLTKEELKEKYSQSDNSLIKINMGRPSDLSICSNNLDTGLNSSQILSTKQKKMINSIESKLDEYNEKSNFTNINMIPKSIDLLIEKEKQTFGYLKTNILVAFLLLFFSNFYKENMIVSFSYHFYKNKMFDGKVITLFLCIIYAMQVISLFFVLPLKKINILMKKYLIIFMIVTLIFILPLLYSAILESKLLVLFIASGIILLCSIITILASCYLSYLLPPGWKISSFSAGKLPLYLIIFGKFMGALFGMLNVKTIHNIYTIFVFMLLSYGGIIIYLLITNNFRIKVIARIMRKRVFENFGI